MMLGNLIEEAAFLAHGYCLLWKPWLVALHAGSDLLIALAYFAIPVAIYIFMRKRPDLEFSRLAWAFIAFISLCGLTHLIGLVTLWLPIYEIEGFVKAATAVVSLGTVVLIYQALPRVFEAGGSSVSQSVVDELVRSVSDKEQQVESLRDERSELVAKLARRAAELAEAKDRFELALSGSEITVFNQDKDLRYTWIHNGPEGLTQDDIVGKTDADIFDRVVADQLSLAKREAMLSGEPVTIETEVPVGDDNRWYDLTVHPLMGEDHEVAGVRCVAIDITAHKQHEENMRVVMRELAHRSKNLLAIIIGISNMTTRFSSSAQDFHERFSDRLHSLSEAHDALTDADWAGADLRNVIDRQLAPYREEYSDAIEMAGDPVWLKPNAVQYLTLAIHELVANAAKHGGLSARGGSIEVSWDRARGKGADGKRGAGLILTWKETFEHAAAEKPASGFGRVILERIAPDALRGSSTMKFRSHEFVYTLFVSDEEFDLPR